MNIKNFDLNLLRVLAALEKERNVSRAAQALGLTQPAISNALQRLRQQCNDPLFVRGGRVMEPTPLALSMKDPIEEAIRLMEASLNLANAFDAASSAHVFKVAMSDVGEKVLLPSLAAQLIATAPGIGVEALRLPTADYADALRTGLIDLAIGNLSLPQSGFYQQHLFSDRYVCVVGDANAATVDMSLERYLTLEHVIATGGNAEHVLQQNFSARGLSRKVRMSVVHYHMAALLAARTELVATLPENAVQGIAGLRILPLPFSLPRADIRQFWHRRVHVDPANKWLRLALSNLTNAADQPHGE